MTDVVWTTPAVLGGWLVPVALKGAALLSMVVVATALLRRAPAAARHLAWVGASVGLLVLPAWQLAAPSLGVPLPGLGWAERLADAGRVTKDGGGTVAAAVEAAGRVGAAAGTAGIGAPGAASTTREPVATEGNGSGAIPQPAGTVERRGAGVAAAPPVTGGTPVPAGTATAPRRASLPGAAALAGLVWAVGALLLLASLLRSLLALRRLERGARAFPPGRVTHETARLSGSLGIRRPVRLLEGSPDAMPVSWGLVRGTVLLPRGAERWHRERLRSVLLHELAHVRRRDCLTQAAAEVARALHWPDPLAWTLVRRLRVEREHACDDHVLASGAAPEEYASELVSLARSYRTVPPGARAAVAMARPSSLEARLRAVLDPGRGRSLSRPAAVAVSCLALVATAILGAATPAPPAPTAPTGPSATATLDVSEADGAPDAVTRPDARPPALGALVAEGARAAPQEAPTCGLEDTDWNSHSHHVENDDHRLSWSRPGCSVDIRIEGEVEFDADFRDVARLGRGARIRIAEEDGRTDRTLELTPGAGGAPQFEYEVDGDGRDFDAAARRWYEGMLLQIFRRGGFMAEERVRAILARGGVPAVLQELDEIPSDHVFASYVEELLRQAELDEAAVVDLVGRAEARVDSDHYLAGILEALAERTTMTDRVMDSFLSASQTLDSDHYRAGVLMRALERGDLGPERVGTLLVSASEIESDHYLAGILEGIGRRYALEPGLRAGYLRAVSSIESDHYRASVLTALLDRNDLDADELAVVLRAASAMESDHYVTEVLAQVADRGLASGELVEAYFAVTADIESDHYRSQALTRLLEQDDLSPELMTSVIRAVGGIESEHYRAGLLVEIAKGHRLDGAARAAYVDAMDSMESSHYRGQVADALLRQERGGA